MRIQHIDRNELASPASGSSQPWLEAAFKRLLTLPNHPRSRILVATEDGRTHAILGLELKWAADGHVKRATIRVLEVDPDHDNRGVGSRLVRVAEDIAHINGCERVCVAPGLERSKDGPCRLTFGRYDVGRGFSRDIIPPIRRSCV